MIIIEGVEKTMANLNRVANQIHSEIAYQILSVGDATVERLKLNFPDLLISGQFFEINLEYWIGISATGKSVTWIKCPVSNLFFKRQKNEDGSQDFSSTAPELDIEKYVEQIAGELTFKINQSIGVILK